MPIGPRNPQAAFLDLLVRAMTDAAVEHKLTQLQTTISPDGTGKNTKIIRLIIVPEEMDFVFPKDQPLGTDGSKN